MGDSEVKDQLLSKVGIIKKQFLYWEIKNNTNKDEDDKYYVQDMAEIRSLVRNKMYVVVVVQT